MATRYVTCPRCSSQNIGVSDRCSNCGSVLDVGPMPMQPIPNYQTAKSVGADKKLAAGLCAVILGGLGIHKFVLGYQKEGIILLSVNVGSIALFVLSCGLLFPLAFVPMAISVITLIEGILYLTKSDEEFYNTYILNKKFWF